MKRILLVLDDEKYTILTYHKSILQMENRKKLTWEDFLCDWVNGLFKYYIRVKVWDKAIEEAMKSLKPEVREEFQKVVRNAIDDKLRYYS